MYHTKYCDIVRNISKVIAISEYHGYMFSCSCFPQEHVGMGMGCKLVPLTHHTHTYRHMGFSWVQTSVEINIYKLILTTLLLIYGHRGSLLKEIAWLIYDWDCTCPHESNGAVGDGTPTPAAKGKFCFTCNYKY